MDDNGETMVGAFSWTIPSFEIDDGWGYTYFREPQKWIESREKKDSWNGHSGDFSNISAPTSRISASKATLSTRDLISWTLHSTSINQQAVKMVEASTMSCSNLWLARLLKSWISQQFFVMIVAGCCLLFHMFADFVAYSTHSKFSLPNCPCIWRFAMFATMGIIAAETSDLNIGILTPAARADEMNPGPGGP